MLIVIPVVLLTLLALIYLIIRGGSLFQLKQQQNKFSSVKQEYLAKFNNFVQQDNFADEQKYYKELTDLLKFESKNVEIKLTEINNDTKNIFFIFQSDQQELAEFKNKLVDYSKNLSAITELGIKMEALEESLRTYFEIRQYVFVASEDKRDYLQDGRKYDYISLDNLYISYARRASIQLTSVIETLDKMSTDNELFNQFLEFVKQNVNRELEIITPMVSMESEYNKKSIDIENKYGTLSGGIKFCISATCYEKRNTLKNEYLPGWSAKVEELVNSITENKQELKDIIRSWTDFIN